MDTPNDTTLYKTCYQCKTLKPLCEFGKDSRQKDKITVSCKKCRRTRFRPIPKEGYRICSKCGESKFATTEFFYPYPNKIGLAAACISCTVAINNNYIQQNQDKVKQSRRDHYSRNREKIQKESHDRYFADVEKSRAESRARNTKWRNNNRKRYHEIQLKYRTTHKKRVNYNHHAWYIRNLEHARMAARLSANRRRAKLLSLDGHFTKEDILLAYRSQKGKCWHCFKKVGSKYHADHLISVKRGGSNDPRNIVISCPVCNLSKGSKSTQEWNGRLF